MLEERFAPITSAIGFLNRPVDECVDVLVDWFTSLGRDVARTAVSERFPDALHQLEPLDQGHQPRHLFVQTTDPNWTAMFGSGRTGTDPSPLTVLAGKLRARAVWVDVSPDTVRVDKPAGRYGGVQFRLMAPDDAGVVKEVRSVWATRDGGSRWRFGELGQVQPFEQLERYGERRVRSRFTSVMLRDYCRALGIDLFDSSFYSGECVLTEFAVSHKPGALLRTLADEQAYIGLIPGEAAHQRE